MMPKNNKSKSYFILLPKNPIEGIFVLFRFLLRKGRFFYSCPSRPYVLFLQKFPVIGSIIKNKFLEYDKNISDFKGLWYQINDSAIRFTKEFYDKNVSHLGVTSNYLNKKFSTDKFEAFIKKRISKQIFTLLKTAHLAKDLGRECTLIIKDDKINRYVVEEFNRQHTNRIKIIFFNNFTNIFLFLYYWAWLIKEFTRRGFVFKKERPYFKLSVESASGFHRKVDRDDILIDGKHFTREDVLFCQFNNKNAIKNRVFNDAKERGFHGVSVCSLPINVKNDFLKVLNLYFFTPLSLYLKLLFTKQSYLLYNFLYFFKQTFPFEVLLRRYRIGCKISVVDIDDVAETIILNKYGTKNIICNWSDLTPYQDHSYAFIAHNIYFVWGNIHYDYHSDNYFVDKKINIGCIFKNEYNKAVKNKENTIARIANLKKGKKIVTFFDTSFSDGSRFNQSYFLEYLAMINEFCRMRKGTNVLLKAKNEEAYAERIGYNNTHYNQFQELWSEVNSHDNFSYLSPLDWGIEEIIAVSNVCVNMGLNSPSTIALICGKNGLYFDLNGNDRHPFAKKYRDVLVFTDKNLLFKQVDDILDEKFNYNMVISKEEIREFDAFDDDRALERMRAYLSNIVCGIN